MATASRSSSSQHWGNFLNGLESAFNWPKTFILFYSSTTAQKAMINTFLLNGIVFLGSIVFLETYYSRTTHSLFGCAYADLIGFPMYFALLVINGKFYSKVAEKSLQVQNKNASNTSAGSVSNAVQSIAATVYTTIFYINCGVFASLLRSVPVIGVVLSFAMNCLIMSYYCFEYRWVYMGWPLEQRISYVEQHWSFFLGFGLPATLLTFFLSTLRSGALFPLVYPSYVIMAFLATPKASSPSGQPVASSVSSSSEFMLPNKIPAFLIVRKLNKLVISLVRLVGGVRVESIMADKKDDAVKKDQ